MDNTTVQTNISIIHLIITNHSDLVSVKKEEGKTLPWTIVFIIFIKAYLSKLNSKNFCKSSEIVTLTDLGEIVKFNSLAHLSISLDARVGYDFHDGAVKH